MGRQSKSSLLEFTVQGALGIPANEFVSWKTSSRVKKLFDIISDFGQEGLVPFVQSMLDTYRVLPVSEQELIDTTADYLIKKHQLQSRYLKYAPFERGLGLGRGFMFAYVNIPEGKQDAWVVFADVKPINYLDTAKEFIRNEDDKFPIYSDRHLGKFTKVTVYAPVDENPKKDVHNIGQLFGTDGIVQVIYFERSNSMLKPRLLSKVDPSVKTKKNTTVVYTKALKELTGKVFRIFDDGIKGGQIAVDYQRMIYLFIHHLGVDFLSEVRLAVIEEKKEEALKFTHSGYQKLVEGLDEVHNVLVSRDKNMRIMINSKDTEHLKCKVFIEFRSRQSFGFIYKDIIEDFLIDLLGRPLCKDDSIVVFTSTDDQQVHDLQRAGIMKCDVSHFAGAGSLEYAENIVQSFKEAQEKQAAAESKREERAEELRAARGKRPL